MPPRQLSLAGLIERTCSWRLSSPRIASDGEVPRHRSNIQFFAKVAERGRWHSERAMRCYINSALNDVGKDSAALDLAEQRRLADQLRLLPVKG